LFLSHSSLSCLAHGGVGDDPPLFLSHSFTSIFISLAGFQRFVVQGMSPFVSLSLFSYQSLLSWFSQRFFYFSRYVRNGNGSQFSATFYSDNHGDTWSFATHSMVGSGTSESEIAPMQHKPGTLMFNHRGGSKTGAGEHVRYASFSTDDGLTWNGFTPVPALPDPFCESVPSHCRTNGRYVSAMLIK
jgi:hypothetical protein